MKLAYLVPLIRVKALRADRHIKLTRLVPAHLVVERVLQKSQQYPRLGVLVVVLAQFQVPALVNILQASLVVGGVVRVGKAEADGKLVHLANSDLRVCGL